MNAAPRPYRLPGHIVLDEPRLRFGSRHGRDVDTHPIRGLLRFGPHSRDKISAVSNPIRIAMIVPAGDAGRVVAQIRELEQAHRPRERKALPARLSGIRERFRRTADARRHGHHDRAAI